MRRRRRTPWQRILDGVNAPVHPIVDRATPVVEDSAVTGPTPVGRAALGLLLGAATGALVGSVVLRRPAEPLPQPVPEPSSDPGLSAEPTSGQARVRRIGRSSKA